MGFGIYCILLREDIFVEINNDTHFESVLKSRMCCAVGRLALLLFARHIGDVAICCFNSTTTTTSSHATRYTNHNFSSADLSPRSLSYHVVDGLVFVAYTLRGRK